MGTNSTANPISPAHLSAAERLAEIAGILAAGVMRLKARQSRQLSTRRGESSVDFTARQSRHDLTEDAAETGR
jgi:hypothetical protein